MMLYGQEDVKGLNLPPSIRGCTAPSLSVVARAPFNFFNLIELS